MCTLQRAKWKHSLMSTVITPKLHLVQTALFQNVHFVNLPIIRNVILKQHDNMPLKNEGKDDAAGFLGIQIECNESYFLQMKQEGLTDHVIKVLELDVCIVNGKATPAEAKP